MANAEFILLIALTLTGALIGLASFGFARSCNCSGCWTAAGAMGAGFVLPLVFWFGVGFVKGEGDLSAGLAMTVYGGLGTALVVGFTSMITAAIAVVLSRAVNKR